MISSFYLALLLQPQPAIIMAKRGQRPNSCLAECVICEELCAAVFHAHCTRNDLISMTRGVHHTWPDMMSALRTVHAPLRYPRKEVAPPNKHTPKQARPEKADLPAACTTSTQVYGFEVLSWRGHSSKNKQADTCETQHH